MGFNPWICLFVATTGGWIGGLVIYGVGYAGNATRDTEIIPYQRRTIAETEK